MVHTNDHVHHELSISERATSEPDSSDLDPGSDTQQQLLCGQES